MGENGVLVCLTIIYFSLVLNIFCQLKGGACVFAAYRTTVYMLQVVSISSDAAQ